MLKRRTFLVCLMAIFLSLTSVATALQDKKYTTLSKDVNELKEQFNNDQDKLRILMLLAPT